ncbi:MAG TPA: sigma-70 family RNA polymerase sigma factor [Actinomycetota bacterium]|nr:sigma-70 family RNA polymerase sigma factor [Actinomycetota bacterium]
MAHEPSDADLIARVAAGDHRAFGALVTRHEDKIFSIAYRVLGNRPDALDATQDAFLSAFRKASKFRGEAAFSTWLYRISINACNDLLRKKKRWVLTSDPEPAHDTNPRPDEDAVRRVDLQRALASLQPDYREAVVLHDIGGVPYEEIARITSTQVGTVKSRISRGRKRLAELLEQPAVPASSKTRT